MKIITPSMAMEIIIGAIAVFVVFFLLICFPKRTPEQIGKFGEEEVSNRLSRLPDDYIVMHDVTIPTKYGTSQIDQLVLSVYGIFVIETKNYSGRIYGHEKSDQWKETFYEKSAEFHNPIKQNWGHVYALAELLNAERRIFIPIVVFPNDTELRITTTQPVVHMKELNQVIEGYQRKILTTDQVKLYRDLLAKKRLVGEEVSQQHVQYVRKVQENKENELRQGLCPRCDGKLVLRSGKYGPFYGCSNYPRCTYTLNMKNTMNGKH